DLRAELLESRLRLLTRPTLERARDDVLAAGQASLRGPLVIGERQLQPEQTQLADERDVLRVREPLGDELRPLRPDTLDLLELLERRTLEDLGGPEVLGQAAGDDPAHLRDVQPEEDTRERLLLRALDGLVGAGRRDLREALELRELLGGEAVEVGE